MVLSIASGSMDVMSVEELPKIEVPLKRKRPPSENRRRKVKREEAETEEFIFETEATVGLFELKQSPGDYIANIVNPLLRPGHDTNLYRWLYHMNLLKLFGRCPVPDCIGPRMKLKVLRRGKDKAVWEAANGECKHKLPMKANSFFTLLRCDLSLAITIIKEFCSNTPMSDTCLKYGKFVISTAMDKSRASPQKEEVFLQMSKTSKVERCLDNFKGRL